jgi:hypothetical protein
VLPAIDHRDENVVEPPERSGPFAESMSSIEMLAFMVKN